MKAQLALCMKYMLAACMKSLTLTHEGWEFIEISTQTLGHVCVKKANPPLPWGGLRGIELMECFYCSGAEEMPRWAGQSVGAGPS